MGADCSPENAYESGSVPSLQQRINDLSAPHIRKIFYTNFARELLCASAPKLIHKRDAGSPGLGAQVKWRTTMRIRLYIALSILVLLACCACAGSSAVEMKQARQAMDQARSLHADDLAPTDFQQAMKAWDRARTAAREGRSDTAKVLFSSAKIYFERSGVIAKSKREALARQLNDMQLVIKSNLDQVKSDLSKKHLSPRQQGQVRAITSEVAKDKASIEKLVNEEDLLKAVATAKDVQTKIYNAQLIIAGQTPER
jgi:hypothetical protein